VRVVAAESLDEPTPLPEVVVLGDQVLYEVRYTVDGAPDGAVRYDDPTVVAGWAAYLRALYAEGEDVAAYVEHVPPRPAGAE
jgi:hypothetical protein